MYRAAPDERQLAALGLKPSDLGSAAFVQDVFPENMLAVEVFQALDTQWRAGFGGVQGLDYGALPAVLRLMGVPRVSWKGLFSDLRAMEGAVLEMMQS